jgi:hypothetical protein
MELAASRDVAIVRSWPGLSAACARQGVRRLG